VSVDSSAVFAVPGTMEPAGRLASLARVESLMDITEFNFVPGVSEPAAYTLPVLLNGRLEFAVVLDWLWIVHDSYVRYQKRLRVPIQRVPAKIDD